MPILEKQTSLFPASLLVDSVFEPDRTDRHWWAVFTRSRQEKALARDLASFGVPFFLPLLAKPTYIRSRVVEAHLPLFPGYLFLFATVEERVLALTTNRVVSLLTVADQDRLRHDLAQLHRLLEAHAPLTVEQRLRPGERVRIRRGSLQGLEGTIISRRAGRRRLLVAVEFLQHGVSVEIDDFMVEGVG